MSRLLRASTSQVLGLRATPASRSMAQVRSGSGPACQCPTCAFRVSKLLFDQRRCLSTYRMGGRADRRRQNLEIADVRDPDQHAPAPSCVAVSATTATAKMLNTSVEPRAAADTTKGCAGAEGKHSRETGAAEVRGARVSVMWTLPYSALAAAGAALGLPLEFSGSSCRCTEPSKWAPLSIAIVL